MTTIAYKAGILACDGMCTAEGDIVDTRSPKIGRVGTLLFGASGDVSWGWAFRSWIRSGMKGDFDKPDRDTAGFVIMPDDYQVLFMCKGMERRPGPMHADGSGYQYALGAMEAGKTAEQAVRIAMRRDRYSGGTVQVVRRP